MIGENFGNTYLKCLKVSLNYSPWLEKSLKFPQGPLRNRFSHPERQCHVWGEALTALTFRIPVNITDNLLPYLCWLV